MGLIKDVNFGLNGGIKIKILELRGFNWKNLNVELNWKN